MKARVAMKVLNRFCEGRLYRSKTIRTSQRVVARMMPFGLSGIKACIDALEKHQPGYFDRVTQGKVNQKYPSARPITKMLNVDTSV